MVLEKIFGVFGRLNEDEYIELDTKATGTPKGKVLIKVERIDALSDADKVLRTLRAGLIVLANIKGLKERDLMDLKIAIDKLKRTCIALNGYIACLDENWVLICPNYAHITRG